MTEMFYEEKLKENSARAAKSGAEKRKILMEQLEKARKESNSD